MSYYIISTTQNNKIPIGHQSQNQNTSTTIDRQNIHPRRNRNLTTPRVQFNIPSSPTSTPLDLFQSSIQSTPPPLILTSPQQTPNILSDYLGSTLISKKIRENHFNHPTSTHRLPLWMTQTFSRYEPNHVNKPIKISTETPLSISETLFLPSTPSVTRITP